MARRLRKDMSLPEVLLWERLRRRQGGIKFRRQHPIAGYVADFYCADAKLVIEIDGEAHNRGNRPGRDTKRDAALAERGLRVLHVAAADVLSDVDAMAAAIAAAAKPLHRPSGGPPPHAKHGEDFPGAA
jgi:very-short-patch-repair endonuclease